MEKIRVLITVKTYPIPSSTYDELVCTAGVTEKGEFIRLYPINFRDLPYSQQFKKYQWIEIFAEKHKGRDVRKESYRPDSESIKLIGGPILTKKGDWSERGKYVLHNKSKSMEDLYEHQNIDRTSLGIFKPKIISDLIVSPDASDWKPSFKNALRQARLWEDRTVSKEPPRKIPFKFHYKFACDDERCKGKHKMMIEDWEVGALFWKLVDSGNSLENAANITRDKFFNEICGSDKDTHFYVGTILAHPKTWVIIGVYWPKLNAGKLGRNLQTSLFD